MYINIFNSQNNKYDYTINTQYILFNKNTDSFYILMKSGEFLKFVLYKKQKYVSTRFSNADEG